MTMVVTDPMAIIGFVVFDRDGEEVGEVEGVFMGPEEPDWAVLLLPTGRYVLVPLADADIYEDSLDLPFTASQIHEAPLQQRVLPEDLTQSQEDELTAYFAGGSRPVAEAASTAKDQGRQLASTAVDRSHQVASTAKQQSRQVASTAKAHGQQVLRSTTEQARQVATTAKEQAAEVSTQVSDQVGTLLEETKTRLEEQAATGASRLGEQLQRLGEEALALSDGRPAEAPTVQGYVKRAADTLLDAADRAYGLSDDVQTRGIAGVLSDVQTLARRRPGAFLLGAAAVGVVAGRAVRAAQAEDPETTNPPVLPRRTGTTRGGR